MIVGKYLDTPEHGEIVLPPLTFMVDPIMNLMSEPRYEYERREHHSLYHSQGALEV